MFRNIQVNLNVLQGHCEAKWYLFYTAYRLIQHARSMSIILAAKKENDWVYVISENNQEGFIPHSYCAAYGSQMASLALNVKKKLPRDTG